MLIAFNNNKTILIIHLFYFLGTLMGDLQLESLICRRQYGEDTVNLNC